MWINFTEVPVGGKFIFAFEGTLMSTFTFMIRPRPLSRRNCRPNRSSVDSIVGHAGQRGSTFRSYHPNKVVALPPCGELFVAPPMTFSYLRAPFLCAACGSGATALPNSILHTLVHTLIGSFPNNISPFPPPYPPP